jgi:hypothetical protein
VPPLVIFVIDKFAVPVFLMVNVWVDEVEPTLIFPKLCDVWSILKTGIGVEVPLPDSATVDGEPDALHLLFSHLMMRE